MRTHLNWMVAAGSAVVLLAESATGGSVVSWGNNLYGQTNVPPSLSNSVAVSGGGNHSGALRSDGTVVAWGGNAYIQTNVPPSVTNVVAIATGANHSLALRADGRVLVWGSINTTLTNVPAVLSNAVAISAGDTFSMGLQINGTVTAWGMSTYQLTNLPAGLSNVVAISAGKDHGIALRSDGTVIAWGNNSSGQTNVPAGLSNVASVAAGDSFSVAMLADGTVTAWGLGSRTNVPADLSNVVAVAAGGSHSLALREDGTMRSWGIGPQTNVPSGLSNVIAIAAGSGHSLSLFGDAIPVISRQPEGLSIGAGPGVTLRAVVTGRPPLSFQWQKNGTNLVDDGNIRGSKSATLALISAQFSDSGNYSLIVSNAHGMTVTSNALVAVIELPDAVDATNMTWATGGDSPWFPQSTVTHDGVDAARSGYLAHKKTNWIQTDVVGPGVLSFWWKVSSELDYDFVRCFQNGVPAAAISGEVGWEQGSLYLGTGTNTVRWQYAKDDSVAGVQDAAWLDEVVLISGGTAPQIVTQPVGTNVVAGLSAILNVGLIGTPPFVSQWLLNGAVVLGGTNTTLNVINVQNTDVGDYRVVVSNDYGSVTSEVATISVTPSLPVITSQPPSRGVLLGWPTALSVGLYGSEPLNYQWVKDGVNGLGATNGLLPFNSFQTEDAGTYWLVVSNVYGAATSSVARLSVTTIYVWGRNDSGQTNVPPSATNVLSVACGWGHVLALRNDGTIATWGFNVHGETNVPANLSNVVAVAAGQNHSLALQGDGIVVAWGAGKTNTGSSPNYGQSLVPASLSNVVAISAGTSHSLALCSDGTVVGWGANIFGQATIPNGLSNVVAIRAGFLDSLALRSDGTMRVWGNDSFFGSTNMPASLGGINAIASGNYHNLALRADGTVVAWGYSSDGQTNVPSGLTNVVEVAAGNYHSLALRADGHLVAWGAGATNSGTFSNYGQSQVPAALSNVVAVAGGGYYSVALVGAPPMTPLSIANPARSGSVFNLQIPTRSGHVYRLEYKNSLSETNWQALPLAAGNGGLQILTDSTATSEQRFYRVRRW